jgi:hypothetical protein
MIVDLLPTRLWSDGRRWCAVFKGRRINGDRPAWMPWMAVDYAPGCVATCRDHPWQPERDLRRDEIEAIVAWLESASAA